MAVQHEQLPFLLVVPPGAAIAADLRAKIGEFGGRIVEEPSREFTVYVGVESRNGEQLDGWVLGNQGALVQLVEAFGTDWPAQALRPGEKFIGEQLVALSSAVSQTHLRLSNVDGEGVKVGLLRLIEDARACGGTVYLQ